MSRSKPTVLVEYIDKKTYKAEQVLQAEAIWAVFYDNAPFNLKSSNVQQVTLVKIKKKKKQVFQPGMHIIQLVN